MNRLRDEHKAEIKQLWIDFEKQLKEKEEEFQNTFSQAYGMHSLCSLAVIVAGYFYCNAFGCNSMEKEMSVTKALYITDYTYLI